MATTTNTSEAITALRQLSVAEIESRLSEMDAERRALQTILRSLHARDRARRQAERRRTAAT